jgi:hypothetical protein
MIPTFDILRVSSCWWSLSPLPTIRPFASGSTIAGC